MARFIIIVASLVNILAILGCDADAANLDAPLNDKPTVRSEIARGFKVSFDCAIQHTPDAEAIMDCVLKRATDNEQIHPDYRPYELGLYYGGCIHIALIINLPHSPTVSVVKKQMQSMYGLFRTTQEKLQISDEQLVDGTGVLSSAKPELLNQLNQWAATIPKPN